jgi:A/G-specific adenine glycosylase
VRGRASPGAAVAAGPDSGDFAGRLVRWQKTHGRHDLPWQGTTDPYRVWLSEIMLQQTQVAAVIPYYARFLERFPDCAALAAATEEQVMQLWSGLGYYSRARNLHKAARRIVELGGFPRARADIEALPGIGRSTVAAIAAFSFGAREAILDGNVKRVLARHFAVPGYPGQKAVEDRLWVIAESLLPHKDMGSYTQGIMDLGASLCARREPRCTACPVRATCRAAIEGNTSAYPQPKPVKPMPQRQTVMLVLQEGDALLFEKRPSPGIWGGLWSFPEMPEGGDIAAFCRDKLGCEIAAPQALAPLLHGFTHFRLAIAPWRCLVTRRLHVSGEPGRTWLPLVTAGEAAIPVPVRKILAGLGAGVKAGLR